MGQRVRIWLRAFVTGKMITLLFLLFKRCLQKRNCDAAVHCHRLHLHLHLHFFFRAVRPVAVKLLALDPSLNRDQLGGPAEPKQDHGGRTLRNTGTRVPRSCQDCPWYHDGTCRTIEFPFVFRDTRFVSLHRALLMCVLDTSTHDR